MPGRVHRLAQSSDVDGDAGRRLVVHDQDGTIRVGPESARSFCSSCAGVRVLP